MEKKDVFVKTTDLETADTLKKDGFVQVDYSAGVWTFLQCKEKYEDRLCFVKICQERQKRTGKFE